MSNPATEFAAAEIGCVMGNGVVKDDLAAIWQAHHRLLSDPEAGISGPVLDWEGMTRSCR